RPRLVPPTGGLANSKSAGRPAWARFSPWPTSGHPSWPTPPAPPPWPPSGHPPRGGPRQAACGRREASEPLDRPAGAPPIGIIDLFRHDPIELRGQAVHDRHRGSHSHPAGKVDDVGIEHAEAPRGGRPPDGLGVVGAMDAIERIAKIE